MQPGRQATPTRAAPCGRRRDAQGKSKFLTCFWVLPTGVGRSRLLTAAVTQAPFLPPRWVIHLGLNSFLDQDTHLLATQQPRVLQRELEARQRGEVFERRRRARSFARPLARPLAHPPLSPPEAC